MKNILLLESIDSVRISLACQLAEWGFNVNTTSSLEAAFKECQTNKIDIAIVDCDLHNGMGMNFAKFLHLKRGSSIEILGLSGNRRCIYTLGNKYPFIRNIFTKPINYAKIYEQIGNRLKSNIN